MSSRYNPRFPVKPGVMPIKMAKTMKNFILRSLPKGLSFENAYFGLVSNCTSFYLLLAIGGFIIPTWNMSFWRQGKFIPIKSRHMCRGHRWCKNHIKSRTKSNIFKVLFPREESLKVDWPSYFFWLKMRQPFEFCNISCKEAFYIEIGTYSKRASTLLIHNKTK